MNSYPPILIDLDGVLRIGKTAAPGLPEFISFLSKNGIRSAILSNTTLSTAQTVKKFFDDLGITLTMPLLTASNVTANYVKSHFSKAAVFAMPEIVEIFNEVLDMQNPEVVVMGDLGKQWTFDKLNTIFKFAYEGVPVIAMQKNKYWKTPEEGLLLDLGAFVKAIEYASGREAGLIGKPSPLYFREGLKAIGADNGQEFLMLGDDLINDIYPVEKLNGKGILIYTGKTKYPLPDNIQKKPDYEAMNLFDVINILKNYL